ncbi:protein rolling stone-like [Branchiostoma floridae x Branchiostoma belcheri]
MDFRGRLRQEFRLKSIGLDHTERHDFTRSPWFSSPKWFLVYRAVICLYQICTFATTKALYGISAKSLIYLTELGYIILTAHTIVSAILCFVDLYGSRFFPKSPEVHPTFPDEGFSTTRSTDAIHQTSQPRTLSRYYKWYWVLYNVAFGIGVYITIAYWALLADSYGPSSILFHAMNTVVIVIDVFVSGLPYRLLHLVYPSAFGFAYVVFTVIYWVAGGTDFFGRPWIYPVIDYGGNPAMAAGVAAGSVLVAIPLCHVILFGLALAREKLKSSVVVQEGMRSRSIHDSGIRTEQHRDAFNA